MEQSPNLKPIGIAIHNSPRDGKSCNEVRCYIRSKYLTGKIRRHCEATWAIENSLHWQLDVTFNEGQNLLRKGYSDTNFSTLRRAALSMLKNEKTAKVGIKNRRPQAGRCENYLEKVLLG
jgi:hypothetical protein